MVCIRVSHPAVAAHIAPDLPVALTIRRPGTVGVFLNIMAGVDSSTSFGKLPAIVSVTSLNVTSLPPSQTHPPQKQSVCGHYELLQGR